MSATGVELVRTRYVWWVFAVFWGFTFLLTASAALNPSIPALGRISCGLTARVIGIVMWRARKAGIEVSTDGILVRQYSGRSVRVSWSDVESFVVTSASPFNSGVYIAVRAGDGRLLKTQGLVAPSRQSKSATALVERLESHRPG